MLCFGHVAPLCMRRVIKAQARKVINECNAYPSKNRFSSIIPTEQGEYGISKIRALGNNMSIFIYKEPISEPVN
jgi:hypothetical protein